MAGLQPPLTRHLPMASSPSWPALLEQLLAGLSLTAEQAEGLMRGWLAGEIEPVLTGALLAALRAKGVSGEELAAMATVLRQATTLPGPRPAMALVDTCGTGGDGADSFNISTAVAFVAAAAGVPVAKHGNRSASGKVGSADVLEALGLNLAADPQRIREAVTAVGITFLFAPGWHPAMKRVAPVRKTLGVRTVFNLLGPLVNPLRPTGQVIGVYRRDLIEPMAQALGQLGCRRAIVLHGREKLDEVGLGDRTDLAVLRDGRVELQELDPLALGLEAAPLSALQGGDLAENQRILRAVLQGQGTPAQRDAVAVNAALALVVGERAETPAEGLAIARDVLASGAAWGKLEQLAAFLRA